MSNPRISTDEIKARYIESVVKGQLRRFLTGSPISVCWAWSHLESALLQNFKERLCSLERIDCEMQSILFGAFPSVHFTELGSPNSSQEIIIEFFNKLHRAGYTVFTKIDHNPANGGRPEADITISWAELIPISAVEHPLPTAELARTLRPADSELKRKLDAIKAKAARQAKLMREGKIEPGDGMLHELCCERLSTLNSEFLAAAAKGLLTVDLFRIHESCATRQGDDYLVNHPVILSYKRELPGDVSFEVEKRGEELWLMAKIHLHELHRLD